MGRKPVGPKLAERVEASAEAKQRLEVVLETITGAKTMDQACRALGIEKSMLFVLRRRALQAAAESLQAQRIGRPPLEAASEEVGRIAELEAEILRLQAELKASQIRVELATALPHRGGKAAPAQKKKNRRGRRRATRLRNACHCHLPRTSKFLRRRQWPARRRAWPWRPGSLQGSNA
jgi:hypothetical protein